MNDLIFGNFSVIQQKLHTILFFCLIKFYVSKNYYKIKDSRKCTI